MSDTEIIFKKIIVLIKKWFQKKVSEINHIAVIKDIYNEVEISVGYFLVLSIANLIALSGLLTNSAPVIIGAMLISPLMGPILSFGFAFITGEEVIMKKALRKIATSVILTIIIAALASFVSPLKDVTSEIISRTRPNLYDLNIAFLSGIAGAVALCTKKNYLTIVPGVAIATAVIPPLSVTGYGIGVGSMNIAFGGFFLFFTNFVAIIIATCAVFYMYGFKPSILNEADLSHLKKRVTGLAVVLFIISIPLIYTLEQSISEVRTRQNIQGTLKRAFDKEHESSLLNFKYLKRKDGQLEISAVVNTVNYLEDKDITNVEERLKENLGSELTLYLDQVKVQPGRLKEEKVKTILPDISAAKQPWEIIRSSRENVISVVRKSSEKIDTIISPSKIADFQVGFQDKTFNVSIAMKIRKDTPMSEEEILWLKRILTTDINLPVDLSVETVPFVPLLVFNKGETELSDEMKTALEVIRDAYGKDGSISLIIESNPESSFSYRKRIKLSEQRAMSVSNILIQEYKIPESNIKILVNRKKAVRQPFVKVTVRPKQGR